MLAKSDKGRESLGGASNNITNHSSYATKNLYYGNNILYLVCYLDISGC